MNHQPMKYLTILLVISSTTWADLTIGHRNDDRYSDYRNSNYDRRFRDANSRRDQSSHNQQTPAFIQQGPTETQDPRYEPRASEFVSRTVMNVAYTIGRQLAKQNINGAHVFSPVCIASALSLVMLGANGRTHHELLQFFGYDKDQYFTNYPYKIHEEFGMLIEDVVADALNPYRYRPDASWKFTPTAGIVDPAGGSHEPDNYRQVSDYHKIHMANGIFVQTGYNLRPDYKSAVQGIYRSEVTSLDFQRQPTEARNYINQWVNSNTFGKIPTIISGDLQRDVNVIMGSALYFKALWDNKFIDAATVVNDFYPDGPRGHAIKVNMMANGGIFPFYDSKEYNCKLMGLPYKGNLTTMYIFQPYDSTRQRLREFQEQLTPEKIEEMISKMTKKSAVIAFPKLHIENSLNLRHIFADLGYNKMFSSRESDLSLLTDLQVQQNNPQPAINQQQSRQPQLPAPLEQVRPQPQPNRRPDRFNTNNNNNNNNNFHDNNHQQSLYEPDLHNRLTFANRFDGVNGTQIVNATTITAEMETTTEKLEETTEMATNRTKRAVTYKVESNLRHAEQPLTFKDLVINKRITKLNPDKKLLRIRRQTGSTSDSVKRLDMLRNSPGLERPPLFIDDIVHKVDLVINEQGTEGGAATVTYLRRSGTDAVMRADTPFLILIRHDTTKIPLFYGAIYEPTLA